MRSAALRVADQPVRRHPARTERPGPAGWAWGPFTEVVVRGRDGTRVYRVPGAEAGLTVPEAFKCSSVELGPIPSPLFVGEPYHLRVTGEPAGGTVQWVSTIGTVEASNAPVTTLTPTATGQGFVDAEYRVVVQGRDTVSRDGRVVTVEPAKVRVRFPQGRAVQVGSGLPVEVEYLAALPDGVQVTLSGAPGGTTVTSAILLGGATGQVRTVQVAAGAMPSTAVNDVEITVSSATAPATALGRGQVTVWQFTPGTCTGTPDAAGRYVLPYQLKPVGFAADEARVVVRSSDNARAVFQGPAPAVGGAGLLEAAWEEFDWVRVDPWAGPYGAAVVVRVGTSTVETAACRLDLPRLTVREEAFATGLDTTTVSSACVPIAGAPLNTTTGLPNLFVPYSPVTGHTLTVVVEPPSAVGRVRLRSAAVETGQSVTWSVSQTAPLPATTNPVTLAGLASGRGVVGGAVNAERVWTRFNTSTVPTRGFVVESAPILQVPVVVHLVKSRTNSAHDTQRTVAETTGFFQIVNALWGRQAGVQFDVGNPPRVSDLIVDDFLTAPNETTFNTLVASGNAAGYLDVYFVQGFSGGLAGTTGVTSLVKEPAQDDLSAGAVISDAANVPARTTAHELGHALGLDNWVSSTTTSLPAGETATVARCEDDMLRLMFGVDRVKGIIGENATLVRRLQGVQGGGVQSITSIEDHERTAAREVAQKWVGLRRVQ